MDVVQGSVTRNIGLIYNIQILVERSTQGEG